MFFDRRGISGGIHTQEIEAIADQTGEIEQFPQ
jgi:hypothetical protein